MSTFVVPDLHGRMALAHGLLEAAGIIDESGERVVFNDEVNVVQLGDLVNCVSADHAKDLAMIERADDWFDACIVGNHELPYFGGPSFSGFRHFDDLGSKVRGLGYLPALAVGNTLLTHAGVHPGLDLGATAQEAEAALYAAWRSGEEAPGSVIVGSTHPYFATIGRERGGWSEFGGVTWSDWHEARDTRYNQVHGHTPLRNGVELRFSSLTEQFSSLTAPSSTVAINLDCGGHGDVRRIVGLWLDDDGQPGEFVEYVHQPVAA